MTKSPRSPGRRATGGRARGNRATRRATLRRAAPLCGIAAPATCRTVTETFGDARRTHLTDPWPDGSVTDSASDSSWGFHPDGREPGGDGIYLDLVVYRQLDNAVLWASGTYDTGACGLEWSVSAGLVLRKADGSTFCAIAGVDSASDDWAQAREEGLRLVPPQRRRDPGD